MFADGNDPGARNGNAPILAKNGGWSKRQGLVFAGLLVVSIVSASFFGGRLFWDIQQRQHIKILERLESVEGGSAELHNLNLVLAKLDADFEQIEIWALNLEQQLNALSGSLVSIRESQSGPREWEARYRRLASQVDKLRREVIALQESSGKQKFSQGGALLLLARLRENLFQGRPCAVQLKMVRTVLGDMEKLESALEALISPCENGVQTPDQIESEFRVIADEMMPPMRVSPDTGWWAQIQGILKGLVRIRPINPDGNSQRPAEILAKTEAFLMSGNLSGALATIGRLGVVKGVGANWINLLKQRVVAIETIDQIIEALIKETEEASRQNE